MEQEKPLHVQVAEALGTLHTEHDWEEADWVNQYCRHGCDAQQDEPCAPRYNTDWSVTGPLIEKYRIDLDIHHRGKDDCGAYHSVTDELFGPTPLTAVCRVILELAKAGKL